MASAVTGRSLVSAAGPRVEARMLLGIALVAVCVAGGLTFWSVTRETTPVLVASKPIPRGHVIQDEDLAVAPVRLDGTLSSLAIPEDEAASIVGQPASSALYAGEMLIRPRLSTRPAISPGEVAVTVSTKAEAVYNRLQPGDAVAVLATRAKGRPESQTQTVLDRAVVYDLALEPSVVSVGRTGQSQEENRKLSSITLLVARSEMERLAHAVVNWDITLALLPPDASKAPESPRTTQRSSSQPEIEPGAATNAEATLPQREAATERTRIAVEP